MKLIEALFAILGFVVLVGWLVFSIARMWGSELVGSLRASQINQGGPGWVRLAIRRSVHGPGGLRRVRLTMGPPWLPSWTLEVNQVEAAKLAEILETAAGEADR
jgi:hypothetical protein